MRVTGIGGVRIRERVSIMVELMAMSTHGHAALAESQNVKITPIGWGALIQAPENSSDPEWIHYNIPTPLAMRNARPNVLSVTILYDTSNGGAVNSGAITNVHVWDGNVRILAIDGLQLTGKHLTPDPNVEHNFSWNMFVFPAGVSPNFGLGVSLGYHFDPDHRDAALLIAAVIANFILWPQ